MVAPYSTLRVYLCESTSRRSTQLDRFLGTSGDWSELSRGFLRNRADLLGPLGTLGVGGVSAGLILTLLLIDSLALNNIVINLDISYITITPIEVRDMAPQ